MTAAELRSALAFTQAELTILAEAARELDETQVYGDVERAGDLLRHAFDRLRAAQQLQGERPTAWFGRAGEACPL